MSLNCIFTMIWLWMIYMLILRIGEKFGYENNYMQVFVHQYKSYVIYKYYNNIK